MENAISFVYLCTVQSGTCVWLKKAGTSVKLPLDVWWYMVKQSGGKIGWPGESEVVAILNVGQSHKVEHCVFS